MKTMFDTVDRLGTALSFHRARHAILAGNVANVDTPGFRPFDLERTADLGPGAMSLRRTHAAHQSAGTMAGGVVSFDDSTTTVGADGNAVNLERELAKLDANRVRFTSAAELVTRQLALLRYAATDGN